MECDIKSAILSNTILFDIKLLHNKNYMKTKVNSYVVITIQISMTKNTQKGCRCVCLSVIVIDLVCEINKNYYPQVF